MTVHTWREWGTLLFKAALIGLLLAILIYLWREPGAPTDSDSTTSAGNVEIRMVAPDQAIKGESYSQAVAAASPSVVNIYANKTSYTRVNPVFLNPAFRRLFGDRIPSQRAEQSLGSGVIVSENGYVLTNNHVIENADDIQIVLSDNRVTSARIVGTDPDTDLALLQLDITDGLPTALFAAEESLAVGDVVLAIGNPFGIGQTVTMGIVSAVGREQQAIATFADFIQTDAAINAGNSGGALINTRGELVGINTAIFRESDAEGIGFAIPTGVATRILQQLVEHGRVVRGWLGVAALNRRMLVKDDGELSPGIELQGVVRGGPAYLAGLRDGDLVTHFNTTMVSDVGQLRDAIADTPPGTSVHLQGVRGNRTFRTDAILVQRPDIGGN